MSRSSIRLGFLFAALVATAAPAAGQNQSPIFVLNFTDPFYDSGRQSAITAAATTIRNTFDYRGTVTLDLDTFNFGSGGQLAQGGSSYIVATGFTNFLVFQRATTNSTPFSPPDGGVTWNNNGAFTWHTGAGNPPGGQFDMQTVALHEIGHNLGFSSLINSDGSGGLGNTPGQLDRYSRLDSFLRVGNVIATAVPIINSNSSFNTSVTTAQLAGNNIYFYGEMAMAANGGNPVRMAGGGDRSHLQSAAFPNSVMQPAVPAGTARRAYTAVEIGLFIDLGWNQYFWKNNTGNWNENISSVLTPRWRNLDNGDVLSPIGNFTPNLVLTFGGTGGYTSTNGLTLTNDRFRMNRLILNATAGTSTIAAGGLNMLQFDTTIGVAPLIRQDGAGGFNITHPIDTTAANLILGGAGAGVVSLGGVISGPGNITKSGTSTFVMNGNTINTYTGTTTVSGGILTLAKTGGANAVAGNVTIGAGGTLRLGGDDQMQGAGTGTTLTLSGGTLNTGLDVGFSDVVGSLQMTQSSTIALGLNDHDLRFTGITGAPTGTLTITGWVGSPSSSGTAGKILFENIGSTPNSTYSAFLSSVQFQAITGATFLSTGETGVFELAPVPEPATVLALAAGALGLGAIARRRRSRDVAECSTSA